MYYKGLQRNFTLFTRIVQNILYSTVQVAEINITTSFNYICSHNSKIIPKLSGKLEHAFQLLHTG
jgi:hypothetical protein